MPSLIPPRKGLAYTAEVSLVDQADTKVFKTSPTLAAGDVTVSKDGGSFANVATLPSEIGSTGALVLTLSITEMDADRVAVRFHDVAGAEWCDLLVTICTAARQIDDLAYPSTGGRSMDVDADGGVEVGSLQAGAITEASMLGDCITSDQLASSAIDEIATTVWANVVRTLTTQPEGTIAFVYTLISRSDGTPIPDAYVWATLDLTGITVLASGFTNQDGRVTLYLDPGTVYVWARKTGWNFSNPDIEEVVE